jgi:hypothetical protein
MENEPVGIVDIAFAVLFGIALGLLIAFSL